MYTEEELKAQLGRPWPTSGVGNIVDEFNSIWKIVVFEFLILMCAVAVTFLITRRIDVMQRDFNSELRTLRTGIVDDITVCSSTSIKR